MFDFGDIVDKKIARRREVVFIILAGFFLGTLAILNILGISRQIDLSFTIGEITIPFIVFVGVLPYPITFLCTDFIKFSFVFRVSDFEIEIIDFIQKQYLFRLYQFLLYIFSSV